MNETVYIRDADLEWQALGTHGLRRKTFHFDEATGGMLNLVDIPVGWRGGGVAHFHDAFEEVYILSGAVTVGAERWFKTDDYFYRPAQVVHGHDERSIEGCRALIRSDGPLTLNLVHAPTEPDEYPRLPTADARGHILHMPTGPVPWGTLSALPAEWAVKLLSRNPKTGAMTLMARVPAGWRTDTPLAHRAAWSAYVLEGAMEVAGGTLAAGEFGMGPAQGGLMGATASENGATLFFWFEPDAGMPQ